MALAQVKINVLQEYTEPKLAPVREKPPVDPATLTHRQLLDGPFWQRIPKYRDVTEEQFLDHKWQAKNSVTSPEKLLATLDQLVHKSFYDDVAEGFRRSPMSTRVSPYLLSLIDWDNPYDDPLRTQFIPVGSRLLPDHPRLTLDSLHEQADAPVPGLIHRYPDKALLLVLDTCPVYCRFCTRSYAVGLDTAQVEKISLKAKEPRWDRAFEYIASRPELEDIVISGGDVYQLRARQLEYIGIRLLEMDNIRRIRFATKGPAVMPQKLLTDHEWVGALAKVVERGRQLHKEVAIHTHFNHPSEITQITKRAMDRLFELGVRVRNQSVLQRRVNDDAQTIQTLVKRLSYCNIQPYYVYVHDMVKGVDDLRTTLQTGIDIEKEVRGTTAGFNTPTFVCDTPGGGGKREIHSYEHYDPETGVSVYTAPSVKEGYFLYFDPIDLLDAKIQRRWRDPVAAEDMVQRALNAARRGRTRAPLRVPATPPVAPPSTLFSVNRRTMSSTLPSWLQKLDKTPLSERGNVLQELVVEEFRSTLLFEESEPLPLDESYFALGLTSLGAVEIQERLEAAIGHRVDSASLFNNPTIGHLVSHLRNEVIPEWFKAKPRAVAEPRGGATPGELSDTRRLLKAISGADPGDAAANEAQKSRNDLLSGVLRDLYES